MNAIAIAAAAVVVGSRETCLCFLAAAPASLPARRLSVVRSLTVRRTVREGLCHWQCS